MRRSIFLVFGLLALAGAIAAKGQASAQAAPATPNAPLPAVAPAPAGSWVIYDEALAPTWIDYSFDATVNFAATAQVFAGARSIAVTLTAAYGGLYLHTEPFAATNAQTAVSFWARAAQTGERWSMRLMTVDDSQIGLELPLASYGGDPTTSAWRQYTIPFSAFQAAGQPLGGIIIEDAAGVAGRTLYIDNLTLTGLPGNATNCTAASLTANPPSPQPTGAVISFSASATGCPTPEYRFVIQEAGIDVEKRGYSSVPTYTWNTALDREAPGTYLVRVEARQSGSAAPFEAVAQLTYVLQTGTGSSCAAVSESASPSSPRVTGTVVTVTSVAGGCSSPTYQYWLLSPGAGWTIVQSYGPSGAFSWNTAGLASGAYQIAVWVRQQGSAAGFEWSNQISYTLTAAAGPCSAVSESASPASPQAVGTAVTITALASGCPTPLYQFWIQTPSAGWSIAQAFSANGVFNWSTAGLAPGAYQIAVWAKQQGSIASFEWSNALSYTLTAGSSPCSSLSETANPASPQAAGATITFSALAGGCATPFYQYWILAPGAGWTVARAYSASGAFSWNTAGLAAGTYQIAVWAKQQGSTASFEWSNALSYSLTSAGGPCTAVSESVTPASPQPVGTAVTVTALASGCATPSYQFWLLPPGAGWSIVQPFGASAIFNWSTTGLAAGTYQVAVWARQSGSTAAFETAAQIAYTLTAAATGCTSATLTPSLPSPQDTGATITFSATAAGPQCTAPQYRFVARFNNDPPVEAQGWSQTRTWTWNTAALQEDVGSYLISVEVRSGAQAPVQATAQLTYVLQAPNRPCTSAGLTSDLATTQPIGVKVTFTASATGCDQPQYRFVVTYNSDPPVEKRGWSQTPTWLWDTAASSEPAGTYTVTVHARQYGTTVEYQAQASLSFTLSRVGLSPVSR